MSIECPREQDVLDALASQRWPSRCDDDLREHVTACGICTDLVDVASALLEERDRTWIEARLPPSPVVWWKAQLRAREEAARAAARPLAFIQGVAASCAVWFAVTILRAIPQSSIPDWRRWLMGFISFGELHRPSLSAIEGLPAGMLLILGLALSVILAAPVAIYFAASEE